MKPLQMSFEEVYSQLEEWGSDSVRQVYARQGAGDNQFGVMLGKLRGLAKKIKTDHELAVHLWSTGNADAQILATMLMDSQRLSAAEIEEMLAPITYPRLIDEFVYKVVKSHPQADALRVKWIDSPEAHLGRAGWNLQITHVQKEGIGGPEIEAILRQIETEVKSAPSLKQEAMNQCLVEIGTRYPEYTRRAIEIGERLGRLDNKPIPKGCTSSYAPEWIAAILNRKN